MSKKIIIQFMLLSKYRNTESRKLNAVTGIYQYADTQDQIK